MILSLLNEIKDKTSYLGCKIYVETSFYEVFLLGWKNSVWLVPKLVTMKLREGKGERKQQVADQAKESAREKRVRILYKDQNHVHWQS